MSERYADNLMRELIEQIDARLKEAERVSNQADQQYRDRPFWPERRRKKRGLEPDQPKSPEAASSR